MKRPFQATHTQQRSLSDDLTKGLIITMLIVSFIVGPATILFVAASETNKVETQTKAIVENLALVIAKPLWEVDQATIEQIATAYLENEMVIGLHIREHLEGTIYAVNPPPNQSNFLYANAPVYYENQYIGDVEVFTSKQFLMDALLRAAISIILATMVMIVVVVLVARWSITKILTNPLNSLIVGVQNIADGNYEAQIPTTGLTDMDAIVDAVNEMAAQISARDAQLNKLIINLEKSEHQYKSLIHNASDIIYTHDLQGKITSVNPAGKKLLGDDHVDVIGMNVADFLSAKDYMKGKTTVEILLNGTQEAPNLIEMVFQTQDGRFIPLEVNLGLVENAKNMVEAQGIARNITKRKLAEEKAALYLTELERSNQELQNFAYVASHDLQEPLRKIQTFSNRLQTKYVDQLDERGLDYLKRMHNASERMSTLITDLLTFSRITSRAKPFVPVDLTAVINTIFADMEIQIAEKQTKIEIAPLTTINADETQMHQLFQNLISNGLKFTQPDIPPHIQITAEQIRPHHIEIKITDNGIGFEPQYNERIFEMFQRLHGRHEYEGTGIGLAICRKIVERHQGTITAVSLPNQGTTFTITLPTNL